MEKYQTNLILRFFSNRVFDYKKLFNTEEGTFENDLIKSALDTFMRQQGKDWVKSSVPEALKPYLNEEDYKL